MTVVIHLETVFNRTNQILKVTALSYLIPEALPSGLARWADEADGREPRDGLDLVEWQGRCMVRIPIALKCGG